MKLQEWKKTNSTSSKIKTIQTLVENYKASAADGYRIKSKGAKLKYKGVTTKHYIQCLDAYVLAITEKQQILDRLNNPYKLADNNYYTKKLQELPLKDVTRSDIEIWHRRLEDTPTAANRALAALSVVFEWDAAKLNPMFKGVNPCLRISKFKETKDKKYIDNFEKVLEITKYTEEQQWRDPHFLTFYRLLMEEGERISDHHGLQWKKPINKTDEKECTGWIDFRRKTIWLKDTKNREPAEVEITDEMFVMLQKLQNLISDENTNASFAVGSKWVFPRPTDPTKHINNSSYRVKLRNFHYKMGLTTREHIRGTGQRKVYKYTNHLTLKHLRKTKFYSGNERDTGDHHILFDWIESIIVEAVESMSRWTNSAYNESPDSSKKFTVADYWGMYYDQGGGAVLHNHWPYPLSFGYYLRTPEGSSPLIIDDKSIQVVEGRLIIFAGHQSHEVPESEIRGRSMIAGNISYRGVI